MTIGDQPSALTPADEQSDQRQMVQMRVALHYPAPPLEDKREGELVKDHPPAERDDNARSLENERSGFLQEIVEILGKEVKSKGLLIDLFHKVHYRDLARGLQAYDRQRIIAAA